MLAHDPTEVVILASFAKSRGSAGFTEEEAAKVLGYTRYIRTQFTSLVFVLQGELDINLTIPDNEIVFGKPDPTITIPDYLPEDFDAPE